MDVMQALVVRLRGDAKQDLPKALDCIEEEVREFIMNLDTQLDRTFPEEEDVAHNKPD